MLYTTNSQKPVLGSPLNWSHPLVQAGLMWFATINEGAGPTINDVVGIAKGSNLTLTGGPTWASGATSGLSCAGTSGTVGASAALPPALRLKWPVTLAVGMKRLGATVSFGTLFCLARDSSGDIGPGIMYTGTGGTVLLYTSGQAIGTGFTTTAGADYVLVMTIGLEGTNNIQLYVNGSSVFTGTATDNLAYVSTAQMNLGYLPPGGPTCNSLIYWAALWNQELPASLIVKYLCGVNAPWSAFASPGWLFNSHQLFTLSANPGTFTFVGEPAGFGIGEHAGAGGFSLTGEPAGFGIGESLGAGSFSFTGEPASFMATSALQSLDPRAGQILGTLNPAIANPRSGAIIS
jgi:hypothetical protein